jgi:hypothetical protein
MAGELLANDGENTQKALLSLLENGCWDAQDSFFIPIHTSRCTDLMNIYIFALLFVTSML